MTITTVGFGDLTAGTSTGRVLVTFEALLGQIFLVTLVARLVSMYGTRQRPARATAAETRRSGRRAAVRRAGSPLSAAPLRRLSPVPTGRACSPATGPPAAARPARGRCPRPRAASGAPSPPSTSCTPGRVGEELDRVGTRQPSLELHVHGHAVADVHRARARRWPSPGSRARGGSCASRARSSTPRDVYPPSFTEPASGITLPAIGRSHTSPATSAPASVAPRR